MLIELVIKSSKTEPGAERRRIVKEIHRAYRSLSEEGKSAHDAQLTEHGLSFDGTQNISTSFVVSSTRIVSTIG